MAEEKPWEKYQKAAQKPWEKYTQKAEEDTGILEAAKEYGKAGLQKLGQALDYPGGIVRTGAAAPFMKSVSAQDVLEAVKGRPLAGAEILKRAGMGEGGQLSNIIPGYGTPGEAPWYQPEKGGLLDPTGRGAAGFALETATDPLALASLGVKSVAKQAAALGKNLTPAQKLLQYGTRPVGTGLEDIGKKLYKSGFKRVDEMAERYNKLPASEVLFNRGVSGTNKQVMGQTQDLLNKLRGEQTGILSKAGQKVPEVDMQKALQPLRDKISEFEISKDPAKIQAAQVLKEDLASYEAQAAKPAYSEQVSAGTPEQVIETKGPLLDIHGEPIAKKTTIPAIPAQYKDFPAQLAPSPMQLSGMKSSAQNLIPKSSWAQNVALTNKNYRSGQKSLAQGLREETERAASQAAPELGSRLQKVNAEMGSLLSVSPTLQQEAMKGINKNILTSVDPMVLALEHGGAALPLKKAADLSKTTYFRTKAGRGLYNLGNYGDLLLRRPSVWDAINQTPQGEEQ